MREPTTAFLTRTAVSHPAGTITPMSTSAAPRLYGVRVALDPTPTQQRLLASHAGAARFVFNRMLAEVKANLTAREWERRLLGGCLTPPQGWSLAALRRTWNAHKDRWAPWWREVSKEAFNHGLHALSDALKNWSDSRSGKRAGRPVGFPRFRSRAKTRASFSYTTGSFRPNVDRVSVQLPRVGRVHVHERLDDLVAAVDDGHVRVIRANVSRSQGRWWCSFTVEDTRDVTVDQKPYGVVGVDVGLVDLAVAADNEGREVLRVPAPKALADAQTKLRRLQRKAARQQRGSGRHKVTMRRIGRVHARVANVRADAIHKATTRIATSADVVVVENLHVKGMGARKPGTGKRGRGFNRAVADAALAEVHRQLAYKTGWYGGTLVTASRWYPSTTTCSSCGIRKPRMTLGERTYTCACGHTMDRDLNAATNLAHLAVCPSCREWPGDDKHGRGADQKTHTPSCVRAGGCETSTSHRPPRPGRTRTATPQEVAA